MAAPEPTIFVQIASYRDPECQWTVKDLFEKADRPDRITVGICWQFDPELDGDCFRVPSPRPAQTLFSGDDYVLMIDSHMRFVPGWDEALIEELGRCESPRHFLSSYPPGYRPPDRPEDIPMPTVMRAKPPNEHGDIRFDGETLRATPEKPLRGAFLAAGLLFAPGSFVREIPYDPHLYFDHEEITLAARAFTHGWDVFSPARAFVYHYYNEPSRGETRPLHWTDRKDWSRFLVISRQRYNYLFRGVPPVDKAALRDIGRYGLGKARSLGEYEAFIENLDRYRR